MRRPVGGLETSRYQAASGGHLRPFSRISGLEMALQAFGNQHPMLGSARAGRWDFAAEKGRWQLALPTSLPALCHAILDPAQIPVADPPRGLCVQPNRKALVILAINVDELFEVGRFDLYTSKS
jgi:hypothetical protein